MDDKHLTRLKFIGFALVGVWKLGEDGIFFELNDLLNARNVLYAFGVDGQLVYIGKTVQPLRARMSGYKNPGLTQSTNIKNNRKLHESLNMGGNVEIFILPDNGLLHYGGFHLNLAAGLEDSLIKDLSPAWNGGQKEASNQTLQPIME